MTGASNSTGATFTGTSFSSKLQTRPWKNKSGTTSSLLYTVHSRSRLMQTGWLLKRNPITGSHQMICSCPFIRSILSAIYTGWHKTSSLVLWWHISVSRPNVGFDSPALLLSLLYTPWLFPRVDADMLAHLSGSHRDFTAAIFILLSKKKKKCFLYLDKNLTNWNNGN